MLHKKPNTYLCFYLVICSTEGSIVQIVPSLFCLDCYQFSQIPVVRNRVKDRRIEVRWEQRLDVHIVPERPNRRSSIFFLRRNVFYGKGSRGMNC